LPFYQEIAAKW